MKKTYPLTQAQYDVFTEYMQDQTLSEYNISWEFIFPKHTDKTRLGKALGAIIAARPIFRTRFLIDNDGTPRQYVDENMQIPIPQLQMSEDELNTYINDVLSRPYNLLGEEPLCRFAIVETERQCHLLHGMHHTITDGVTVCTLYSKRDLPAAYAGKPLRRETQTIFEYALEEEKLIDTEAYVEAGKRYAEKFVGAKPTRLSPHIGAHTGNLIQCDIKMEDYGLNEWCRQHHLQHNVLIQAAFCLVLSRWSKERKVSYLSIRHGRNNRKQLTSYGLFANMMPLAIDVDQDTSILDFIQNMAEEWQSTLLMNNHSLYKFCEHVKCMPTIFFSYHGNMIVRSCMIDGKDIPVRQLIHGLTDDDLQCMIFDVGNEHEIHVETNDALYDKDYIIRFAEAIKTCVHEMMNNPDRKLKDIDF